MGLEKAQQSIQTSKSIDESGISMLERREE